MNTISKALARGTIATVAAGAMAMASASPAAAQDRHRDRDRGGISAGEVIAGAVILGGIAAVIASSDNDDRRDRRYRDRGYDDRRYDDRRGYNDRGNARDAVDRCVRAVERRARQRGARADVYEIRDIDRERRGFEVKGRLAVQEDRRGRGRGYGRNNWDEGRFTCDVRRGRVVDLDIDGIRGL